MDQIKDIVNSVLNKLVPQEVSNLGNIEEIWQEIAGQRIQRHTHIAGLKKNQLIVDVDSSAWIYQLNLLKNKLLKDIQEHIPEIKSIYFKIGKVP